ncbi:hypothetical protein LPJ53_005290 [Coemansia erecta]|uniref:Uncharacterized protein n=1 Tax=Coemansia erecta TaxID=147472 RepID=A0A9W7XX22_9FUNG|nr:hypothetical protein LPJ53_005290 [Coemansia erecta]
MQVFKTFAAVAAFAATVLGAIDWTSQETLDCTKENWAPIKAAADQMLPMASAVLPAENAAALKELLNGASVMPDSPSDDFLRALPNAIPAALLESLVGPLISDCLATHVVDAPTSTEAPAESSTDAPAESTTDAPAESSTDAPAESSTDAPAETSSAPAKCIPRN